jgi:ketosteroid isomerase-like protein
MTFFVSGDRTMHMKSASEQVFAALLILFVLAGCATGHTQVSHSATVAMLTKLGDDWDKAIVRKDLPAIANNMCDDFRQIRVSGEIVDKANFLRDITSPELTIDPYAVEDFDIRLYGDVALLSGRTRMTGRYAGMPFTSHYRYIDIYVLRDGRWQVCNVQITRMPN